MSIIREARSGWAAEPGGVFRARVGSHEVARYETIPDARSADAPKPYLHPLRTLGGETVTLAKPHDHPWHLGLSWSIAHVSGANFWGATTYREGPDDAPGEGRYQRLDNVGRIRAAGQPQIDDAGLRHDLLWSDAAGADIIRELRNLRIDALTDDAWALTVRLTMTNLTEGPLRFGSPSTNGRINAGYGGLLWRGPRSFTDGIVHSPVGSDEEELRGARAAWMGFSGRHDGTGAWSTVVIVEDQRNPGAPNPWFVRSATYACLCPAPFFHEELELASGDSVSFRYAVVIADDHRRPGDAAMLAEHAAARLDSQNRTPAHAR